MDYSFTNDPSNITDKYSSGIFSDSFRNFIHYFCSYVSLVVIVIGIIGNAFSIIIFLKRRNNDRASAQYLAFLSTVDFIQLSGAALQFWMHANLHIISNGRFSYHKLAGNELGCKFWVYGCFCTVFLSSWTIVTFSVERVFAIWQPLKMASITELSEKRFRVLAILTIFILIFYVQYFFTTTSRPIESDPNRAMCMHDDTMSKAKQILFAASFFFAACIMPVITITILNVLIVIGIYSKPNIVLSRNIRRSQREAKCVRNVLLLSFFYIIFTLPYCVSWPIYLYFDTTDFYGYSIRYKADFSLISFLAQSVSYCNYTVNPIIFVFNIKYYRQECLKLICCFGLLRRCNRGRH